MTSILSIPLEEVSAKIRVGPPVDDADDMGVPVWAGVVPVALRAGGLVRDGVAPGGGALPAMPLALGSPSPEK